VIFPMPGQQATPLDVCTMIGFWLARNSVDPCRYTSPYDSSTSTPASFVMKTARLS
jgi:hypothetical protein